MSTRLTEAELIALIGAGDSVGLWQVAEIAGIFAGRSRDLVSEDVRATVSDPLRRRTVVAVRLYSGDPGVAAEEIDEPIDDLLERIDRVLHEPNEPDWFESDIAFELPERLRPSHRPSGHGVFGR
jgi:hypothetical protein